MRRFAVVTLMLLIGAGPSFAKTHKDMYSMQCSVLWPAVKDTLRNSGKYGILGIDNTEMTASFVIGGTLSGKRINSVVLNAKGTLVRCRSRPPTAGLFTTTRVISRSAWMSPWPKLQQPSQAPAPAKPESPNK